MTAFTPLRLEEDRDFIDDLPYAPEVLLFDELLEIDHERQLVRASMTPQLPLPLVSAQRVVPVRHPQHFSGGLMVHATGMIGFIHAYYVLGLRFRDGWVGYGTHIHRAVFRKIVPIGEPIEATCVVTRARQGSTRQFIRYELEFRHEGDRCYEGDQSAMWTRSV